MLARCAHTARPMCRARTTHHSVMACERQSGAEKGVADCAPNGACEHPSVLEALLLTSREHRAKDRQARAWVQTKQPRRARGRSSSVMGMESALRALGLRDDTYDQPEKATPVEPELNSAPVVAPAAAMAATEVTYPASIKGLGSPPHASTLGLGSVLTHPHRGWARPCPNVYRDWAHPVPHLHPDLAPTAPVAPNPGLCLTCVRERVHMLSEMTSCVCSCRGMRRCVQAPGMRGVACASKRARTRAHAAWLMNRSRSRLHGRLSSSNERTRAGAAP
jgi:hypothetical protein